MVGEAAGCWLAIGCVLILWAMWGLAEEGFPQEQRIQAVITAAYAIIGLVLGVSALFGL